VFSTGRGGEGLPKKVKKRPVRTITPSMELSSDLRSFLVAFPEGYTEMALEDLAIYVKAFHRLELGKEELEALLEEERSGMKKAGRALYIEKKLLEPKDQILLGSCFCPVCTRFKSYRKECPHCGFHEMTV